VAPAQQSVCHAPQDHLLAVKARLQANLQAAVDQENEDGNSRLAAKQVRTHCPRGSCHRRLAMGPVTSSQSGQSLFSAGQPLTRLRDPVLLAGRG
jgi:hypothetical protein